jgi:hypothetical protein
MGDRDSLATAIEPPLDDELRDLISLRAYQLYLERGATDGEATSDWLRAESEIKAAMREVSAPPQLRTRALPEGLFKRVTRKTVRRKDTPEGKAA